MSPIEIPEEIKRYVGLFGKGTVAYVAPEMLKGSLIEILKTIKTEAASRWVHDNVSLWDELEPKHRKSFMKLGEFVKDLRWLTADWMIQAIKEDCPALASLFLGWRKGYNWLTRQIEIIKEEISK